MNLVRSGSINLGPPPGGSRPLGRIHRPQEPSGRPQQSAVSHYLQQWYCVQENAPAPVINIRQRTSADVAFREIQGCDAGLITDLHKADILRRSALADVQAGKYGSAYRKIVRAAAINPYSSPTAMDRSMIAALYRNRLDTYLYCILLPWLPFFIYTRMLAAAEGSEQGMLTGHELSVGGLFFFYILSLCAAGWIFVLRTRVK